MQSASFSATSTHTNPGAIGFSQRLLTKVELIDYLQISRSHMNRLIFERGLPHIKIGRSIRFRIDDVLAWLARHGGH